MYTKVKVEAVGGSEVSREGEREGVVWRGGVQGGMGALREIKQSRGGQGMQLLLRPPPPLACLATHATALCLVACQLLHWTLIRLPSVKGSLH